MKSFSWRLKRNTEKRRKEVGRRLQEARKSAGLRQGWVGDALGYGANNQPEISRIESGKRLLDVVELENFARLYNKPLHWFETWEGQIKADINAFGFQNDVGLTSDEFHHRVAEIKAHRSRGKLYGKTPDEMR